MFGEWTQVSGPESVCAWPVVCVCFLCNGLQLSAATQPELIGFQWARVKAHPSIFLAALDSVVNEVENLIKKFKASCSHDAFFPPLAFFFFAFIPLLPLILPSKVDV